MRDLENIKLEVDLNLLAKRVERITNYADSASTSPSAAKVLSTKADADIYNSLLFSAQLRLHEVLGRHAKNVVQPSGQPGKWVMLLRVPKGYNYPLLTEQLSTAVADCLANDIAAHWFVIQHSEHTDAALQLWRNAQQQLKNLSLWQVSPARITPVYL